MSPFATALILCWVYLRQVRTSGRTFLSRRRSVSMFMQADKPRALFSRRCWWGYREEVSLYREFSAFALTGMKPFYFFYPFSALNMPTALVAVNHVQATARFTCHSALPPGVLGTCYSALPSSIPAKVAPAVRSHSVWHARPAKGEHAPMMWQCPAGTWSAWNLEGEYARSAGGRAGHKLIWPFTLGLIVDTSRIWRRENAKYAY